jgi:(E)-4-hydroxy-3-methylbut-2-enyl-diphosphate synthase
VYEINELYSTIELLQIYYKNMKSREILRHKTHSVNINTTIIGSQHPIIIQSMTDTNTADINATANQIMLLADAGSEIVRLTVDNIEAAQAVPQIKNLLLKKGYNTPLVGCFHYNGHTLLTEVSECAESLDKYRINPGNVGVGNKKDKNFESIIKIAIKNHKPVRIGVNWGSLDQELLAKMMDDAVMLGIDNDTVIVDAMVESALSSAARAIDIGLPSDKIIISAKVSQIPLLQRIYIKLAERSHYALHLGLTEAGMGIQGIVSSAVALSSLLQMGIGDTIRASITPAPGEARTNEVAVCKEVLQSLGLRRFSPSITSCPGCGRTKSDAFKTLTLETNNFIQNFLLENKDKYPDIENLKIAVMGCIVNGPGESKHADIGISLPGKGEEDIAVVFIDGEKKHTLKGNIFEPFKEILLDYVERRFDSKKSYN